jgi:replicative DNA helicase
MTSAITVCPGPKTNAYGHSVDLDASAPVDSYVRLISAVSGEEAWYAASVYRGGHRSSEDWQAASAVTGDLDYRIPDPCKPGGKHVAPPDAAREAIEDALSDAPGTIAYHTPRGFRVDALLDAPIDDIARWQRAADGLIAQLGAWLRRHHLDGDAAAGRPGYTVDPCARKPAQYMFAPQALVAGIQRAYRVIVITRVPTPVATLVDSSPPPAVPAPTPPRAPSAPESDLSEAVRRYRTERSPTDGYPRPGSSTCPVCCHNGCWGSLASDPRRWACHSTGHIDGVGVRGEACYHGDQLDIDAHAAGRSRVEHLRAEGFLAPRPSPLAPARSPLRIVAPPEPPPPTDDDAPPSSRVPGEDDGDPLPSPSGAPSADYVSSSRRTVSDIRFAQAPADLRAADLATKAPLVRDSVQAALEMMIRRAEGSERPIPLPWPGLADLLGGGLWPGAHVLTGPTATGKSALALQIALCAARAGSPVLYVGLELDTAQIITRLISMVLSEQEARLVHWSSLYLGQAPQELRRAVVASESLSALPIHVEEAPPGGWCASTLDARVRALKEAHPDCNGSPLVILDFLQLVGSEPEARREELRERIGRAAYAGRQIARQHSTVALMLSSISRAAAKEIGLLGKQGELGQCDPADFVGNGKESGDIEFSADTVMALAREPKPDSDENPGPTLIHLAIAKQRAGAPAWFLLRFNGSWFEAAQSRDTDAVEEHREARSHRRESERDRRRQAAVDDAEKVILPILAKGPASTRDLRAACSGDDKTVDRALWRLSDAHQISRSGPQIGGHPTWILAGAETSHRSAASAVSLERATTPSPGAVSAVSVVKI